MRKGLNISLVVIASLVMLIGLLFIVLEGRLLIVGEYSLYDNSFNGFIRYFFRFILSVLAFVIGLFEVINLKKNDLKIKEYLVYGDISLVIVSIVLLIFSTNYVGVVCIVLSSLLLVNKGLILKING